MPGRIPRIGHDFSMHRNCGSGSESLISFFGTWLYRRDTLSGRSHTLEKLEQVTVRGKNGCRILADDELVELHGPREFIERRGFRTFIVRARVCFGRFALRASLLRVSGDSRPRIMPTGVAPTSLVAVWRRIMADPGRTRHPFVFGPLHSLPVEIFLARLTAFRWVHSTGVQAHLDCYAHPVAFRFCARFFRCLTILSVLFHFALSPGTGRGRIRSHWYHLYAARSTAVCTPAYIGTPAPPSTTRRLPTDPRNIAVATGDVAGSRCQCERCVVEGRFVSSGNRRTGVSSRHNNRNKRHATDLDPESRFTRDGSR